MSAINKKRLVVMSDDFGMCPAVNKGIVQGFVEGIVTDSNLMAPCPAFEEASALAIKHNIPVGVHSTFTCDWDQFLWGPMTNAPSFVTNKNNFKDSVVDAWVDADSDEAWVELKAQYDLIISKGIEPTHVGEHMGTDLDGKHNAVMARLANEKKLPHKGQPQNNGREPYLSYVFESVFSAYASPDFEVTKEDIRKTLFSLQPGDHMWVNHCGVNDGSLSTLCSDDFHARLWADTYRINDLALCLDKDVENWITENEIELTPISKISTKII